MKINYALICSVICTAISLALFVKFPNYEKVIYPVANVCAFILMIMGRSYANSAHWSVRMKVLSRFFKFGFALILYYTTSVLIAFHENRTLMYTMISGFMLIDMMRAYVYEVAKKSFQDKILSGVFGDVIRLEKYVWYSQNKITSNELEKPTTVKEFYKRGRPVPIQPDELFDIWNDQKIKASGAVNPEILMANDGTNRTEKNVDDNFLQDSHSGVMGDSFLKEEGRGTDRSLSKIENKDFQFTRSEDKKLDEEANNYSDASADRISARSVKSESNSEERTGKKIIASCHNLSDPFEEEKDASAVEDQPQYKIGEIKLNSDKSGDTCSSSRLEVGSEPRNISIDNNDNDNIKMNINNRDSNADQQNTYEKNIDIKNNADNGKTCSTKTVGTITTRAKPSVPLLTPSKQALMSDKIRETSRLLVSHKKYEFKNKKTAEAEESCTEEATEFNDKFDSDEAISDAEVETAPIPLEYDIFKEEENIENEWYLDTLKEARQIKGGLVTQESLCVHFGDKCAKLILKIISFGRSEPVTWDVFKDNIRQINNERYNLYSSIQCNSKLLDVILYSLVFAEILVIHSFIYIGLGTRTPPYLEMFISIVIFSSLPNLKRIFESFLFIVFSHPYDSGDRIHIDGENMVVREISLLSTTFERWDGLRIIMPNIINRNKPITNIRRSRSQTWPISFLILATTPQEKIEQLKDLIGKFVSDDRAFHSFILHISEIVDSNYYRLNVNFKHANNFQNGFQMWTNHSKSIRLLVKMLHRLKIKYLPMYQDVYISTR